LLRNVDHALFENVNKRCQQQQVSVSVSRCFAAGSGCQILSTSSVLSVGASQKSDARMPASDSPTDIPRVINITPSLYIVYVPKNHTRSQAVARIADRTASQQTI